jgi:hypothetical protein
LAMGTKREAADALKGAGQPELNVRRACGGDVRSRSGVANAASTKD